jgi:hypothetical protein
MLNESELTIGCKVSYKGDTYTFDGFAMMKDPTTQEWLRCAVYTNFTGVRFVRELEDFRAKFKVVEVER